MPQKLLLVENGNPESLELLKEHHIHKDLTKIFTSSITSYILPKLALNYNIFPDFINYKLPTLSPPEALTGTISKIGSVISTLPIIGLGSMSLYYTYNLSADIIDGDLSKAQSDFYKATFFGAAAFAAIYYPVDTMFGVTTVCKAYELYNKVDAFDTVIERIRLTGDTSFIIDLDTAIVLT